MPVSRKRKGHKKRISKRKDMIKVRADLELQKQKEAFAKMMDRHKEELLKQKESKNEEE